jgi:predicted RNA polymerase sigma factor
MPHAPRRAPMRKASPFCSWSRTAGSGINCRSAAACWRLPVCANSVAQAGALQAAIVACHARALTASETDWPRIAALYAELAALTPSPIVELNRAVSVGMAEGPGPALVIVDRLAGEPVLKDYHLLPAVRGDLLHKLGRYEEAHAAFESAAALTGNKRKHYHAATSS